MVHRTGVCSELLRTLHFLARRIEASQALHWWLVLKPPEAAKRQQGTRTRAFAWILWKRWLEVVQTAMEYSIETSESELELWLEVHQRERELLLASDWGLRRERACLKRLWYSVLSH